VGEVLVKLFLVRGQEREVIDGVGRDGGSFLGSQGVRVFFLAGSESEPSGGRGVSMGNGGRLLQ